MRPLHVTFLALALSASLATAADGDFDTTYGVFNSGKNTVGLDLGGSNNDLLSDMLVAPDGSAYLVGTSNVGTGYTAVSLVKMTPQGLQEYTFNAVAQQISPALIRIGRHATAYAGGLDFLEYPHKRRRPH